MDFPDRLLTHPLTSTFLHSAQSLKLEQLGIGQGTTQPTMALSHIDEGLNLTGSDFAEGYTYNESSTAQLPFYSGDVKWLVSFVTDNNQLQESY